MVTIYGLIDPRDNIVRYVGQTRIEPHKRLLQHRSAAISRPHTLVGIWMKELRAANVKAEIVVLEIVADSAADDAEIKWIRSFDRSTLTNAAVTGNLSPTDIEYRRKSAEQMAAYKEQGDRLRAERELRWAEESLHKVSSDEIRQFRTARGWSQARLARELGYHYSLVSFWESGKREIPGVVGLALERLSQ